MSVNDKVLKAIFGGTAEEAAGELARLQAKSVAWGAARALAAKAVTTAPDGAIIVPVLGYGDEPSAVGVEVANTNRGIAAVGVWEFTAHGNVWENPQLGNFTPFEGDWMAWRLARDAAADLAARQVKQAQADLKKQAAEQAVLEKQAAEQAAESRHRHISWFMTAYRDAVYSLWAEKFLQESEKVVLLGAFDTAGKLREQRDAVIAMRNSLMALCPTPVDAMRDVAEADVAAVADVVAEWVNGDLDIAYPVA